MSRVMIELSKSEKDNGHTPRKGLFKADCSQSPSFGKIEAIRVPVKPSSR